MNYSLQEVFDCKHRTTDYCYLGHKVDICPCNDYEERLFCQADCIHYDKRCGYVRCYAKDKVCKRAGFNPDVSTLNFPDRYEKKGKK